MYATAVLLYASPLGPLVLKSEDGYVTEVHFLRPDEIVSGSGEVPPVLRATAHWLDTYFQNKPPKQLPPLRPKGTPFRRLVWQLLLEIPYGQTVTYGDIAAKVVQQTGVRQMSAQAVGNAVGHNPIAILIPCHRVVGANGNLTGYAYGLDRKVRLLKTEHIDTSRFTFPRLPRTKSV